MLEKRPYSNYTLDEDREEKGGETINVRLNAQEREFLDIVKWLIHEPKDGTALKYCLEIGKNVLQSHLSEESLRRICSETRRKPVMKRPQSLEKQ